MKGEGGGKNEQKKVKVHFNFYKMTELKRNILALPLAHIFTPAWESRQPYKVTVEGPRPVAPAGPVGEPRQAAESSFAGAAKTGRGKFPAWPTIRQHKHEAPPRMAGSKRG